jgi:hypothetical protein
MRCTRAATGEGQMSRWYESERKRIAALILFAFFASAFTVVFVAVLKVAV